MLRSLRRVPLCSIFGQNNVPERMEFLRTFTDFQSPIHFRYGLVGSLQSQIVNALRLGERGRAFDLLSHLSRGNDPLIADDFVHILDYCAKCPDPLFVMETWRIMEEKEIGVNNRCYMFILQALTRGGYLEEAFNWLNFLGEKGGPSLAMCNAFLNGCIRLRSASHINHCLDLMESRMMGKSEVTYFELLKLAVWQGNLSAVHEIWKEFTKYYSPSVVSLRKFIWSFTRLRDLASACEALQQMVALSFHGNGSGKISAQGKYRSSRLDIPIPSHTDFSIKGCVMVRHTNQGDKISGADPMLFGMEECPTRTFVKAEKGFRGLSLFPLVDQGLNSGSSSTEVEGRGFSMLDKDILSKPVRKLVRWSFSDVIHACAQSKNYKLAEQLFLQMHNLGLDPSSHTYDGLVKAVVSGKGVNEGLQILNAMEEMKMKPYNATLATLSMGCSKMLQLDVAETLLDQTGKNSTIHSFNALLAACDVADQPERAVRILAKMRKLKLKLDIRTYELLFSLFAHVNAPYEKGNMLSQVDVAKRINAIEADMVKNGVLHSHLSMENLLKALGDEGMIRDLIQYLHMALSQFFVKDRSLGTTMYNAVLHSLVEARESHIAVEVFKDMKLRDLPPDAATYNIMIDCCSLLRCYKSACVFLSLMLRDGFSPQTCTYTALIKILLANEDFDEALRLSDQVGVQGIQPDVLFFNTILQKAFRKGRIDLIELIVERMHQEKIQPDPSTCYYVFSAYVYQGFHNTAMEALQVLSMRMISEEESILQEKRRYFEEDFVLAEDSEVESRIINVFKDSQENLAAALLNLRWCSLNGFSVSWSPNESEWARRLFSSYASKDSLAYINVYLNMSDRFPRIFVGVKK